jgi:predicted nucleotidyltransferase
MRFHISPADALNSKTKSIIVKFLLTHEAAMSEREIASILKVSHMSVNRTMKELASVNFANFVVIGKSHLWKVNHKSYAFRVLSTLINDVSAVKDPMEDLKDTILSNLRVSSIKKIVLFGSVSKKLERTNSDIDIFVLVRGSEDRKKLEPAIEKLSNSCFEIYGNRLAPYILTEREMANKANLKIVREIESGIQIFPGEKG